MARKAAQGASKANQKAKARAKAQRVVVRKPPGRPRIAIDMDKVESHAANGLTQEEIATVMGFSARTLQRRKAEGTEAENAADEAVMSEMAEAIARGRAKRHAWAANVVAERVVAKDWDAVKFYLERQCGWSKTQRYQQADADGNPVDPTPAAPTQVLVQFVTPPSVPAGSAPGVQVMATPQLQK